MHDFFAIGLRAPETMSSYIYVLHCRENKFYIGRTTDLATRFLKHKAGTGAQWTKSYGPLAIIDVLPDYPFAELTTTLDYMKRYGLDNVRGGPWCGTDLLDSQKTFIRNLLEAENFARPTVAQVSAIPPATTSHEDDVPMDTTVHQRHGCVWEVDEINELFDCMRRAVPLASIALLLRRKESAVRSFVSKQIRHMHEKGIPITEMSMRFNLTPKDIEQALSNKTVDMDQYARISIA